MNAVNISSCGSMCTSDTDRFRGPMTSIVELNEDLALRENSVQSHEISLGQTRNNDSFHDANVVESSSSSSKAMAFDNACDSKNHHHRNGFNSLVNKKKKLLFTNLPQDSVSDVAPRSLSFRNKTSDSKVPSKSFDYYYKHRKVETRHSFSGGDLPGTKKSLHSVYKQCEELKSPFLPKNTVDFLDKKPPRLTRTLSLPGVFKLMTSQSKIKSPNSTFVGPHQVNRFCFNGSVLKECDGPSAEIDNNILVLFYYNGNLARILRWPDNKSAKCSARLLMA